MISIGKVLQHNSAAELYINSSLKIYLTKYFIQSNNYLYQIMGHYQFHCLICYHIKNKYHGKIMFIRFFMNLYE